MIPRHPVRSATRPALAGRLGHQDVPGCPFCGFLTTRISIDTRFCPVCRKQSAVVWTGWERWHVEPVEAAHAG